MPSSKEATSESTWGWGEVQAALSPFSVRGGGGRVPESDHLTHHEPQGGEDGGGHGHGPSELRGGTLPQVHGLDVHAYTWPCRAMVSHRPGSPTPDPHPHRHPRFPSTGPQCCSLSLSALGGFPAPQTPPSGKKDSSPPPGLLGEKPWSPLGSGRGGRERRPSAVGCPPPACPREAPVPPWGAGTGRRRPPPRPRPPQRAAAGSTRAPLVCPGTRLRCPCSPSLTSGQETGPRQGPASLSTGGGAGRNGVALMARHSQRYTEGGVPSAPGTQGTKPPSDLAPPSLSVGDCY